MQRWPPDHILYWGLKGRQCLGRPEAPPSDCSQGGSGMGRVGPGLRCGPAGLRQGLEAKMKGEYIAFPLWGGSYAEGGDLRLPWEPPV